MGIKVSDQVIGVAARLSEEKGVQYLVQAMPKILNRFPETTLVIVGGGPLAESLKNDVIQLGINENIVFTGIRLDMPEIFSLFDMYVLPSVSEGLPMVLLEAMASKCPIIATDVGGVSTVIKHEKNGLLVSSRNPDLIASSAIHLLSNKDKRKRYSEIGCAMFSEKYSADAMTKKYEKLYIGMD